MTRKVKVAVIGLGIGRLHLSNYAKLPYAEVVALCDIDERRLHSAQQEFNVPRVFTDYQKLLEMEELEAVSVALPNYLHAPVTIAALRAGKHVLCEKPMALNAQEAEEMLQEAKKARRQLMIHFNQRFSPEAMYVYQLIQKGYLGEIYHGRTLWTRRRFIPGLGGWFTQKKLSGGGPLIDLGVHMLDLALWWMGYPRMKEVLGATFSKIGPRIAQEQSALFDVEDLATGLIRFENGATLYLEASWAGFYEENETLLTELLGTEGGVCRKNGEVKIVVQKEGAFLEETPHRYPPCPNPQEHFVQCILKEEPVLPSGEQGLEVMRILDALYASAQS